MLINSKEVFSFCQVTCVNFWVGFVDFFASDETFGFPPRVPAATIAAIVAVVNEEFAIV
jgi:hypothetical protein